MPSLSQLPGKINRKKFLRALIRLGFDISERGGNGSHYKATWPANQKSITLPKDLRKDVLYYVLKEIETCSNIAWEDIRKNL